MMRAESEEELELFKLVSREFTGALTHYRKAPVTPRIGPRPPSWWTDDDDASRSSMNASAQMGVAQ